MLKCDLLVDSKDLRATLLKLKKDEKIISKLRAQIDCERKLNENTAKYQSCARNLKSPFCAKNVHPRTGTCH